MRLSQHVLTALVVTAMLISGQSHAERSEAIDEPPEWTGAPKQVNPTPDELRQFFEAFPRDEKDAEQVRTAIAAFDKLLQKHPDYSDGYFLKAMLNRCMLQSDDVESILNDISSAISNYPGQKFPRAYESLAEQYSLQAKIKFDMGRYRDSLDSLETAIKANVENSFTIFRSRGTAPDKVSENRCQWSLAELNKLIQRFPKDYQSWLLRGLYVDFFSRFDQKYFRDALQDYQKAIQLNPRSPLPHFFMGYLFTRASFWVNTKSAGQHDEAERRAILAYTNAIQVDPLFLPAYVQRANTYHGLKQYTLAIRDYDRILELDPENASAYADRGLTRLQSGDHVGATFDLGDAIRRKKPNDDSLANSYQYRADAYMKIGDFRNAITDLSNAIARRLADKTFLLSLPQIRGLYPEYSRMSDEALCRKINAQFWPDFSYDVIFKRLTQENRNWEIGSLYELYEKRGDAYLRYGDFRRAVRDFNRIFKGVPNFANLVERWRLLGSMSDGEDYYADVKSIEFGLDGGARLWLKVVHKNQSYTVSDYQFDCGNRRLRSASTLAYDADGNVLSTSNVSREWQSAVPDSIGETLYSGMCSATTQKEKI